ncbi:MAG: hypothetical protein ACLQME_07885 [Alphaproteobacteria bacterium]
MCVVAPLCANAAQKPAAAGPQAQPAEIPYDTPVKAELEKIFNGLASQLQEADTLVKLLRNTAAKNPADTETQIDSAAQTLGTLADRLQPEADLAQQLAALRNAAAVHRKRVQEMPNGTIGEADRTTILAAWDRILQDADKAQASMKDMHDSLTNVLQELRIRKTAVSELMLAGQYQAAVDTLKNWLGDLEMTVKNLHKSIDQIAPSHIS